MSDMLFSRHAKYCDVVRIVEGDLPLSAGEDDVRSAFKGSRRVAESKGILINWHNLWSEVKAVLFFWFFSISICHYLLLGFNVEKWLLCQASRYIRSYVGLGTRLV